MLDSVEMRIVLLGEFGFSGKFIQEQVRKEDSESFSLGTIYKTVRKHGFRLKDYRDGLNENARIAASRIARRMRGRT